MDVSVYDFDFYATHAHVLSCFASNRARVVLNRYPASYIQRNMTDYDLASGEGTTHLYYTGKPLFPFGWGASYTTFSFELLEVTTHFNTSHVATGVTSITHTVRVANTGDTSSAVSVQAFLSSSGHVDAVPNEELYDFGVTQVLSPGESQLISVTLRSETLALVDEAGDRRIESGDYTVRIGKWFSNKDNAVTDCMHSFAHLTH